MSIHNAVDYIEFLSKDIERAKKFYSEAFGWAFTDYGPEYSSFSSGAIAGGFALGAPAKGSVLVILYSEALEASRDAVIAAGGALVKDTFSFPGGRRFHFNDPDGNELAVWSDK